MSPAPVRSTRMWRAMPPGRPCRAGIPDRHSGHRRRRLRMNAGAYGGEFRDVWSARMVSTAPAPRSAPHPMKWAWPIATATRRMTGSSPMPSSAPAPVTRPKSARMKDIVASRGDAQPRGVRTGGSTFANPPGGKVAGNRRRRLPRMESATPGLGKALQFPDQPRRRLGHDIESLGETVRNRVAARGGPALRWEIRRVGRLAEGQVLPARDEGRAG